LDTQITNLRSARSCSAAPKLSAVGYRLSAVRFQLIVKRISGTYTLAQLVAENKKRIVFEINAKKKRVRACAEKSLESATECGKLDAGRAAPLRKESCVPVFTLISFYFIHSRTGLPCRK
jgi:ribosomal protein L18